MSKHLLWGAAGLILLVFSACNGGGNGSAAEVPQIALIEAFPDLTFVRPVALLQHPDDPQRWYVVERGGRVRTFLGPDADESSVLIDVAGVEDSGEGGLLGMALHPAFGDNGHFFLNYTVPGNPLTTRISRFTSADGGISAENGSEQILLRIDQPARNHNGGWIGFGPDGFLYIALGDGGTPDDEEGHAQNTKTLLGAILRIDVNAAVGVYGVPPDNPFAESSACGEEQDCPEIFAWGFRNPWRGGFDPVSGDLWVGDVGQNDREEINLVAAGRNYGWNIMEGNRCYKADSCVTAGLTLPEFTYNHSRNDRTVIGGYVYRGSDIPGMDGDYIFGDYISGRIWRLVDTAAGGRQSELLIRSNASIVSFAQDSEGEIYVIDLNGPIHRLAPLPVD
jgi:glucose/arabinose dehydrogenase